MNELNSAENTGDCAENTDSYRDDICLNETSTSVS